MPLPAGSRLGPYEILAPLGAGGMGEVYRARDARLSRDVAIKVLAPETAEDSAALARFEREAKAVAALSHPNILAIHDFGSSDGATFAVTELLHGETLRQRLDRGPLPQRRAVEIAQEIVNGLAAAHELGFVHRDLKPENLFVTRDGHVKILDFGLARNVMSAKPGVDTTLTNPSQTGLVIGTVGYMAPEQVRGEHVDHRSDVFAFGAVLYEMLSGHRAFRGETPVDTMSAILSKEVPPPSESGQAVAPALERIVAHCLEKRPEDRFQSARDLEFDLGSLSASGASGAEPAIPARRKWRRTVALPAAAVVIAALGVWAGARLTSARGKTADPTFRRLTFRRGNVLSARFAPDGQTVVYGAAWEGKPSELYSVRTDSIESRPLGLERADILGVSSAGELAILLKHSDFFASGQAGTLARVPLGGGNPRELMEDVFAAGWAPDAEHLAVLRGIDKPQLEFPIGNVVFESYLLRAPIAVSPDGKLVAAMETEQDNSLQRLWVIERSGAKHPLSRFVRRLSGFAWSADSKEVFYVGGPTIERMALRAVDLSGHERVLLPAVGSGLRLHDVSSDGRVLLERSSSRSGMVCRIVGDEREREVAWLDGSDLTDLADDGRSVLFREIQDGGLSSQGSVYLRRCDGSPAIRLGAGDAWDISHDGKWALALTNPSPHEILMLPTGAGSPRRFPLMALSSPDALDMALFLPGGDRIGVIHEDENDVFHLSVLGIDRSEWKDLPLPGWGSHGLAFSPDGSRIAYMTRDGKFMSLLLASGKVSEMPGPPASRTDWIAQWSVDGRFLYLANVHDVPATISRREISTGQTILEREIQPAETSGVTRIYIVNVAPDGSYAYSYNRTETSDLFVVDGLK